MSKRTFVALAGALGLALFAGPLAAQPPERSKELIRLRVPVKLKSMTAEQTRVVCWIRDAQGQAMLGSSGAYTNYSDWYDIINGEFDRVIEVSVRPPSDSTFALAKRYDCRLELQPGGGYSIQRAMPVGDPNSLANTKRGRPDQFFRTQVEGNLAQRTAVPENDDRGDVRGGKDLTASPKDREH